MPVYACVCVCVECSWRSASAMINDVRGASIVEEFGFGLKLIRPFT